MLFADDTKVYLAINEMDDHIRLQEDLERLSRWSQTWQLSFNIDKCKVMYCGHNNPSTATPWGKPAGTPGGNPRPKEQKTLSYSNDLKFSSQAAAAAACKANRILGLIWKSFRYMDKVIRSLKLPSLFYRCSYGGMIETFKILTGKVDTPKHEPLRLAVPGRTRGHSRKLEKRYCRTAQQAHCFANQVVDPMELPHRRSLCTQPEHLQEPSLLVHVWNRHVW